MRSASSRPRFLALLYPGLFVKRWLGLLVLGLVLVSLGIGYILVDVYRTAELPAIAGTVTLQFIPRLVRAAIFALAGIVCAWLALWGLYRSAADAVERTGGASLLEMMYRYRLRQGGPRVVCIGGGTGMPAVLRGLKNYTANITAIVTVGDNGGSSGRLRKEHGILPPGDFRNNIVALAEVEPLMGRLFQYRFNSGSALEGHSFGNLFVLAMTSITGNFEQALRETSRVLAVKGTILPSTLEDVTICGRFADGTEVIGESEVTEAGKKIERIFLKPDHPPAQPEAVKAILEADLVVLGPGSLYTSVLPNLLVDGIAKALEHTEALRVYVCNVATQPGETDGYDVEAHVRAIASHLPGAERPVDVVIAQDYPPEAASPAPEVSLVRPGGACEGAGWPTIFLADVVRDDRPLRHDPDKLGQALLRVYEQRPRVKN